ncbi:MAG: hypothetical protein M0Q01_00035 [Syntrophales bacterium]|jgi:hypothetical protein|nr:hypothetical protein [Syntrophales bacterium]
MKKSSSWNFGSIVGRIMMGLVLAAMIGSIDVAPALAKNDKNKGNYNQGRYQQRGPGYQRNRTVYRTRTVYQPYGYRERVYVPPPVYYAPPPPPGIGIFFPPIFIHP